MKKFSEKDWFYFRRSIAILALQIFGFYSLFYLILSYLLSHYNANREYPASALMDAS